MISPFDIVAEISAVLDELDIRYVLGGSVAGSLVGEPRTTVDVDFAVRLRADDLAGLAARVADSYYLLALSAQNAVENGGSFNLLHNTAPMKVDVFVLGDGVLDRNQIDRRVQADRLDDAYLDATASLVGLEDLLAAARADAAT